MSDERLPVHGFVLAGGKSSRMGRDKALLEFQGKPLVEIAVEKLRSFCSAVSICGNRDDLSRFAPVVHDLRADAGPAAGIEAGLRVCSQPWAMFVPVDVPLVPVYLLRIWAEAVVGKESLCCGVSFLLANGVRQPSFSMLRANVAEKLSRELDGGTRKLDDLFMSLDDDTGEHWLWPASAARIPSKPPSKLDEEYWFQNLNTAQELAEAEMWAASGESHS